MRLKGKVCVEIVRDGKVVASSEGSNLVVDTGAILVAKALAEDSYTAPTHVAAGTSTTAASASDTALIGTELGRVALSSTTRTDNEVSYVAAFPAGTATGTVEEIGIFNAASGGEMLCRFLTGTYVKGASDIMNVTWDITIDS